MSTCPGQATFASGGNFKMLSAWPASNIFVRNFPLFRQTFSWSNATSIATYYSQFLALKTKLMTLLNFVTIFVIRACHLCIGQASFSSYLPNGPVALFLLNLRHFFKIFIIIQESTIYVWHVYLKLMFSFNLCRVSVMIL